MSVRRLRSSSRNAISSGNNTIYTTTATITSNIQNTAPTVTTSAVTPLMSIRFPQNFGSQTHSSPDSETTITTPTYSSLTARNISGQNSDTIRRNTMAQQNSNLPTLNEQADVVVNDEGTTLRQFVSDSVEAAQANIMREVHNMQLMLPQLIRESLRSERNDSFEYPGNRPFYNNQSYQPPFNNNYGRSQPDFQPNQTSMFPQQRQPPNNVPQQLFGNNTQNTSQQFPDYGTPQGYPNHHSMNPNQLEKWGIKYDGSNKSLTVEDFVFRVEVLKADYNCSWDIVMKGFHHLVTGSASTWFWSFRMKYPMCDWPTFKHHIIKKFRNFESDFEIQRKIMERRQAPNETADAYITEIVKLKNQMRVHVLESELVKIVKDNLKEGLAQLIFPIRIDNFDHLLEECKRAERNISKRLPHRTPIGNPRRMYELDMYEEGENEQTRFVEAMQRDKTPAKPLTCWNCKAPGHSFFECPVMQRNIFCYRCGFEGVTSPTCPKCVGNQRPNTMKTGTTCSTQNTTQ